jgi:predicted nucleic acid-binding protein
LIFPPKEQSLVGDASFWVSIVASGRSEDILRAIPNAVLITDVAANELERGRARGRNTFDGIQELIASSLLSVVTCPEEAEPVYYDLVGGNAVETLDDGEACTLAYALHSSGCAVIDEKKATVLARRRFPALPLLSTTDLMLSALVRSAIGPDGAAAALFEALMGAKMRVPPHLVEEVCLILGEDRASKCHSLPQRRRVACREFRA